MLANESCAIDFDSLEKLVDRQLQAGTQALVVNGTTGESSTLSKKEQKDLIQAVVKQVNHRIPVIAGTGSACTHSTIDDTRTAADLGVDGCLIVTPYYNKPTQQGLYAHYKTIADNVSVPIIMYNVPSRTGCDLLPDTVNRLADMANIVGLKECVSDVSRLQTLQENCGDKIALLTGNDADSLPAMLLGFKGVISVVSNVVPDLMAQLCSAALSGDKQTAIRCNQRLSLLQQALFIEPNPVPVKFLLHDVGLIQSGIRLPLAWLSTQHEKTIQDAFARTGVMGSC